MRNENIPVSWRAETIDNPVGKTMVESNQRSPVRRHVDGNAREGRHLPHPGPGRINDQLALNQLLRAGNDVANSDAFHPDIALFDANHLGIGQDPTAVFLG